jgi:hypothetical protein
VYGLTITNVYGNVGDTCPTIGVVGEVSGLCCGGRDNMSEGHVVSWPAVEMDSDCRERVGDERGAILPDTDLRKGS